MLSPATLLLALAAGASAHMVITQPVPFGKATLNNSPLGPGDFPCKQRPGVYEITEMNQWNAGETHTVQFMGSAVHGGGSCQFSITTDPEPTEQSQWKVIQSVIGGCPSNVTGNLPGGPDSFGAATFPVTMPKDIPNGRYTFAWTWINKVGNREFYMNCAPIQVGSSSGTASTAGVAKALTALPNMFVANIPSAGCETKAYQDFAYPDPGQNVIKGQEATPGDTLTGTCKPIGAGADKIGSPSGNTPSNSNNGGVFAPGASSAPGSGAAPQPSSSAAAQPSPPAAQPSPAPAPAPAQPSPPAAQPSTPIADPVPSAQPQTPSNPPSQSPDNNNTTPASGECIPCTNDGAVVCIGSKQFGLCNRGCAIAQGLATGMVCTNGAVVAATKRHLHFPRAHLHRRLSAAHLL